MFSVPSSRTALQCLHLRGLIRDLFLIGFESCWLLRCVPAPRAQVVLLLIHCALRLRSQSSGGSFSFAFFEHVLIGDGTATWFSMKKLVLHIEQNCLISIPDFRPVNQSFKFARINVETRSSKCQYFSLRNLGASWSPGSAHKPGLHDRKTYFTSPAVAGLDGLGRLGADQSHFLQGRTSACGEASTARGPVRLFS